MKNSRWITEIFVKILRFVFSNWFINETGPTICPKIRTCRWCTYVLTSSTRCYQLSLVSLIRVLVRFSVRFHMRLLVKTRWWRQNIQASTICTNLRTYCGTSLKRLMQCNAMQWLLEFSNHCQSTSHYILFIGESVGKNET